MKKAFIILLCTGLFLGNFAIFKTSKVSAKTYKTKSYSFTNYSSKVKVKGYTKKNGTYVKPYYRTKPDNKKWNNWSSKGNFNPYTGKKGAKKY